MYLIYIIDQIHKLFNEFKMWVVSYKRNDMEQDIMHVLF
jgi:hypothetical protein